VRHTSYEKRYRRNFTECDIDPWISGKPQECASFAAAVGWMAGLSEAIDGLDHHPEWTNVYDRVRIRCTTHDAGNRITARDAALAKLIAWRHAQEYGP
jgi:pterin-4a-carbinolamine dehydratase